MYAKFSDIIEYQVFGDFASRDCLKTAFRYMRLYSLWQYKRCHGRSWAVSRTQNHLNIAQSSKDEYDQGQRYR